jgi:hypothetical protein
MHQRLSLVSELTIDRNASSVSALLLAVHALSAMTAGGGSAS